MAYSTVEYTGDGTTTDFSIPFTYLNKVEVKVFLDAVDTPFTFLTDQIAKLATAPANGVIILIRRTTEIDAPITDYTDGAILTEQDLDNTAIQTLNSVQEVYDRLETSINPVPNTNNMDAGGRILINLGDARTGEGKDALNVDVADARYVNVDGDTMTGDLVMGGNNITGLPTPTTNDEPATKGYADSTFVDAAGDAMTGELAMGNNKITGVADATAGKDAMNQDASDARYVNTDGDTMTGDLTVRGDVSISQVVSAASLTLSGGAGVAGKITGVADGTNGTDAVNYQQTITLVDDAAAQAAASAISATESAASATASATSATASEVSNVASAASATESSTSATRAEEAARSAGLPVSSVQWFLEDPNDAPVRPGLLKPEGQELNRAEYAALWSQVVEDKATVTEAQWQAGRSGAYSTGNGTTTFRMPDIRGYFIRMPDIRANGEEPGGNTRTFGSAQDDEVGPHDHTATSTSTLTVPTATSTLTVPTAASTFTGADHSHSRGTQEIAGSANAADAGGGYGLVSNDSGVTGAFTSGTLNSSGLQSDAGGGNKYDLDFKASRNWTGTSSSETVDGTVATTLTGGSVATTLAGGSVATTTDVNDSTGVETRAKNMWMQPYIVYSKVTQSSTGLHFRGTWDADANIVFGDPLNSTLAKGVAPTVETGTIPDRVAYLCIKGGNADIIDDGIIESPWVVGDQTFWSATGTPQTWIAVPVASVSSVNGQTGVVVLDAGDVDAFTKTETTTNLAAAIQQSLLDSAVPEPDFHMPLVSDINIREGFGTNTFARASTATYVDKSGVLQTAVIDEPRVEKEGILIEGASTNLRTWRESILREKVNVTEAVFELYSTISPEGTVRDVQKFTPTFAIGEFSTGFKESFQPLTNTTYTFSLWAKTESSTPVEARLVFSNYSEWDSIPDKPITITNSWQRFSITRTNTAATPVGSNMNLLVQQDAGAVNKSILTINWQLETLPFASSYIPTNGSAVTRAADLFDLDTSEMLPAINTDITIAASFDRSNAGGAQMVYRSLNNAGSLIQRSSSGANYGSNAASYVVNHTTPINSTHITTSVFNGTNLALYADGSLVGTSTTGSDAIAPWATLFAIGRDSANPSNNERYLWGHIRNFRIWNQALTATQVATIGG